MTVGVKPVRACVCVCVCVVSVSFQVAAWRIVIDVGRINEVILRRTRWGPDSTRMGDRLRTGKPPRYAISHAGQLSLISYAEQEMSTGQVQ